LKETEKSSYNPVNLLHSIKDFEQQPLKEHEQRDIDEFFTMFMDQLENSLKAINCSDIIKQQIGGIFTNEFICKGCPHRRLLKY
jgi:hypothetical protein